jgi:hypothetical protein
MRHNESSKTTHYVKMQHGVQLPPNDRAQWRKSGRKTLVVALPIQLLMHLCVKVWSVRVQVMTGCWVGRKLRQLSLLQEIHDQFLPPSVQNALRKCVKHKSR